MSTKVDQGRDTSNVIQIRRSRTSHNGRLPLFGAVVRVVMPSAAELTPAQKEQLKGVNVDALAKTLGRQQEPVRRADETDDSYSLRFRHYHALAFARECVLELEALQPTADGEPSLWKPAHRRRLEAVEVARAHWRNSDTPYNVRVIAAVRNALAWYKQRTEHGAEDDGGVDQETVFIPDADDLRDHAIRAEPDLYVLTREQWSSAMTRWLALGKVQRGGRRVRGRHVETWARIVYDLLKPYDLIGVSDSKALGRAWDNWEKSKGK